MGRKAYKLSSEAVQRVIELVNDGYTYTEVGKIMGIHRTMASRIYRGERRTGDSVDVEFEVAGWDGLVVAIMGQAYRDLTMGTGDVKQDAALYFTGPIFRWHLEYLDLPTGLMPKNFNEMVGDCDGIRLR